MVDFAWSKTESGVSRSYETMNCLCGTSAANAAIVMASKVNNRNFMVLISLMI